MPETLLACVVFVTFCAFIVSFCAGLTGLHERKWGWSVLAVTLALVASALVFGALPRSLPGKYGMHLTLRLPIGGGKWGLALGDT